MPTLYAALGGSSSTSDLYTVNPVTGAMASIGATGFGLTALAVDPTDGTLYGVTNVNSGASPRCLVTVDKVTGAGTLIGALGLAAGHNAADICFDAAGNLYGWDTFGGVYGLFPINKSTGAAGASVGNPGANDLSGGLAFDSGGVLHHVNGNQRKVATVNTGTGVESFGATISGAPFTGFCQAGSFDSVDVFYGVHGGGSLQHLVTYDLSTAVVTDIGVMVGTTDALAWDDDLGGGGGGPEGRVLIAFDDGPLEANPAWTRIDDTDNLVAGYDIQTGKQTELDRTDTGTGTVYLHDTLGLFDPLNTGSPYFGKIVGKQILFQLWNPVTSVWVEEWRGRILDYNYDIVGVLGADGKPIVANIQVECVDIFDYLGGYGLQPGVNGNTPPVGEEGTVFYEDTVGTVDDRIIQVLTEVGVDSTRYVVFSGNVKLQETKYDPGDAALTALRDCADAEFPGLANNYVDRFGRYVFHGRRARFDPDGVIADGPVSSDTWDFHRWKVGDGTAIAGDSDYAQIRVLGYTHGESDIVNSAICWPAGMVDTDMPGQVFEDGTSIAAHGKHSLPPMGDLIISDAPTTMNTPKVECAKFAEFFVHYLKDPQTRITSLMVKAIGPDDPRATSTWDVLCKADISDIMRTTVGYPNGVGIDMDNYIEGYTKRVRPLNPTHDLVEVEFNLTPTSWAMDPDGILAAAS